MLFWLKFLAPIFFYSFVQFPSKFVWFFPCSLSLCTATFCHCVIKKKPNLQLLELFCIKCPLRWNFYLISLGWYSHSLGWERGWRPNLLIFLDKNQTKVLFWSFQLQVLCFVLEVNGIAIHHHFSSLTMCNKYDGSMMDSEVFFPSHLTLPWVGLHQHRHILTTRTRHQRSNMYVLFMCLFGCCLALLSEFL